MHVYQFTGCVCYTDDLALLAPSPSALRICSYVKILQKYMHGLRFKTRFGKGSSGETFMFCGTQLEFSQEVIHLGHTLFGKS